MTCFKNPSRHMHRPLAAISSDKMGLDIVLTSNGQVPEYNPDNSISFEGGAADYWYLWPTMIKEIKNETGELIDLYDDAEFTGDNLDKKKTKRRNHGTFTQGQNFSRSKEKYLGLL